MQIHMLMNGSSSGLCSKQQRHLDRRRPAKGPERLSEGERRGTVIIGDRRAQEEAGVLETQRIQEATQSQPLCARVPRLRGGLGAVTGGLVDDRPPARLVVPGDDEAARGRGKGPYVLICKDCRLI